MVIANRANSFECCFCPKRWCKSFAHTGPVTLPAADCGGAAGTLPLWVRRPKHARAVPKTHGCGAQNMRSRARQSQVQKTGWDMNVNNRIWSHTHHHLLDCVSQRLSCFLAQQWCYLVYISLNVLSEALLMWFAEILWFFFFFQISVHSVLPWWWSSINKEFSFEKNSQSEGIFFLYFCFFNSHDCILKWNCQNIVK